MHYVNQVSLIESTAASDVAGPSAVLYSLSRKYRQDNIRKSSKMSVRRRVLPEKLTVDYRPVWNQKFH
jgi:hypothetical protein